MGNAWGLTHCKDLQHLHGILQCTTIAWRFSHRWNGANGADDTLLDSFTLRGPNGTHVVLVTDIVVCVSSMNLCYTLITTTVGRFGTKMPPMAGFGELTCNRNCSRGCCLFLFVKDTARGSPTLDLNIGNFSFAFPQIADQDPSTSSKISPGTLTWSLFYPSLSFTKPHPCRLMSSLHVTLQSIMTRSPGKMSLRQKY